ncbi:MAG TPA: PadR family transcriptional regulator [Ktedonobacterales bacterium]|nr:PadR family transcriptional regulator [Ktedonobacterales bacterium]
MYEFIILAQLMHGPAHGYLIAKIINDIIGPYARISPGRLYPLLAKLEQNGLIAPAPGAQGEQQGDRPMRIYKITDVGRMRFHTLMKDTASNPGEYQRLFAYKVTAFAYITPAERLRLIDHYINYCQAHIFHLQGEADALVDEAAYVARLDYDYQRVDTYTLETILNMMKHSIDQWQHELEWARSLREREVALAQKAAAGAESPEIPTEPAER